jgi:hypothetical protein
MITSHAFFAWAGAKALAELAPDFVARYGIPDTYVHGVCNRSDDCVSYDTHKYIEREPIEAFMGTRPGSGVVGFWTFKDGSRLVKLCPRNLENYKDLWVVISPDVADPSAPSLMVSLEDFPVLRQASYLPHNYLQKVLTPA